MSSILKVDTIQDQSGNNIINESGNVITIGAAGDTITVPAGATVSGFTSAGIDDNATSVAITINSSEQVGIGTASPTSLLSLEASSPDIMFTDTSGGTDSKKWRVFGLDSDFRIGCRNDANNSGQSALKISRSGNTITDHQFLIGNSEKMRLTTTGLGIGTSAPNRLLTLGGTANARLGLNASSYRNYSLSSDVYGFSIYDDTSTAYRLTVKSNGYVGINESAPFANVHVKVSDSGVTSLNSAASGLFIESANSTGMTIASGTTNVGRLVFADSGNNLISYVQYDHSNNAMSFQTNGSERMRIDSSGNVGIGTSSPLKTLEIQKNNAGNSETLLLLQNNSGTDGTEVEIRLAPTPYPRDIGNAQDGGVARWSSIRATRDGSGNGTRMSFLTNSGSATPLERMRIDNSGRVGIGTTSPITPLQVNRDISGVTDALSLRANSNVANEYIGLNFAKNTWGRMAGIYGRNENSGNANGRLCFYTSNSGSFLERLTIQANGNSTFSNNLTVNGSLSKTSGSFKIDHPLPSKKETHNLVHSFVEAPQADNIYRGKINLVNGTATINIDTNSEMSDGTFVLLNREIQCFTSNETGWTAVKGSVSGNTLTITAQDNTCDDTISWMVIGERQDQHMYDTEWTDENGKVIVEPLKETEQQQQP